MSRNAGLRKGGWWARQRRSFGTLHQHQFDLDSPTSKSSFGTQHSAVSYRLCYKLSPVVVMLDSLTKIRSDLKCEGDILWLR